MAVPPTSVPPLASKDQLRAALRAYRKLFSRNRSFIDDVDNATHLAPLHSLIAESRIVAGYWPFGGEADDRPLLHYAEARGKTIALPRFALGVCVMTFHSWVPAQMLETSRGYAMPLENAPQSDPDLILTPLIGFDRALNRLGQGQGHYDRAFLAYPSAIKVGIAWSAQEVAHIPTEPHDIPLDAVLTELEWITR